MKSKTNILPQIRYSKLNIIQKINAKSNLKMTGQHMFILLICDAYVWPDNYVTPNTVSYK